MWRFCSLSSQNAVHWSCCTLQHAASYRCSGHASLAACSQLCHFCKLLTKSLTGAMVHGCQHSVSAVSVSLSPVNMPWHPLVQFDFRRCVNLQRIRTEKWPAATIDVGTMLNLWGHHPDGLQLSGGPTQTLVGMSCCSKTLRYGQNPTDFARAATSARVSNGMNLQWSTMIYNDLQWST